MINGLNRIMNVGSTAFTYDGRGNLTSDGTNAYSYTAENLLKTAPGSTTLAYDPLGRLYETVKSPVTTRFLYDGIDLIGEYDASNVVQRRYVHGPGIDNPIVWYEGSAISNTTRRFLMHDERGSVVSVTDSAGATIHINAYDEYGIPAPGNIGRFGYTGQTWLPELGMWYYKARMFSPTLGRFMQTDPIGYADGMNWYNYVGSDPVNFIDPLGLAQDYVDPNGNRWRYRCVYVGNEGRCSWQSIGNDGRWRQSLNRLGDGGNAIRSPVGGVTTPPQKNVLPCEGSQSDILDAAETVLDYTGTFADAASLGLAGAGVLAAEAPPVAAGLETGAVVAQAISLVAGVTSAGIKAYRGNYVGAVASLGSSAIGRYGARGLGKLANYFDGSLGGKFAREVQATVLSQGVGRTQCPK